MTDWTAVAAARGLGIPDDAMARIAPSLQALEDALRPLTRRLVHGDEPAVRLDEE